MTGKRIKVIVFTSLLIFWAATINSALAASQRSHITSQELLDTAFVSSSPVQNANFLPVGESKPALHAFSGALVLTATEMSVKPDFESRKVLGKDPKMFPGVAIGFFTHGEELVPVTQDVITPPAERSKNSYWELVIQPGKIWSEPGDNGWSRAAFPFGLMHSIENETHNGIATFLFNEDKVSAVRFQVVTQTAPYYLATHFAAWGQVPAEYDRTPIPNLDELNKAYAIEKAHRFPRAEWSVLEKMVGKEKLAGFEGNMDPNYLVWSGIVYDGVLYYKPCKTPYGDYIKHNEADLLVLDMIMDPGIDGLETYKESLKLKTKQKAVITSGFSETDKVKEAQRLGAVQYVKKPYTIKNIGVAIRSAFEDLAAV